MRSYSWFVMFLLVSALSCESALSDEASEEPVSFQVRYKLVAPDINESWISTIRTVIKEGYESEKTIGQSGYKLVVVVEDSRGYEFSVRLDLIDPDGAALASTIVLARDDRLTVFDLGAEDIVSSGTIRVARKSSEDYGDNGSD